MTGLFQRRVRGFRVVEVAALAILLVIVLVVYLSKTGAGRENSEIVTVEQQIEAEQSRLRLLSAEVAFLEQPERIERLSTQYLGMAPVSAKREAPVEALPDIARAAMATPAVAPPAQSAPQAASPSAPPATPPSAPQAASEPSAEVEQ